MDDGFMKDVLIPMAIGAITGIAFLIFCVIIVLAWVQIMERFIG